MPRHAMRPPRVPYHRPSLSWEVRFVLFVKGTKTVDPCSDQAARNISPLSRGGCAHALRFGSSRAAPTLRLGRRLRIAESVKGRRDFRPAPSAEGPPASGW